MQSTDSFPGKLILPPDGRQTRIDFFQSHRQSEPDRHITYARKGSKEWWQTLTSWFKAESPQQYKDLELFNKMLEEKGYSKKSRQSYLFMLRKFFEEFENRDPAKITMGDIEDYNFEFFVSGRYSRPYQLQFINAIKLYYQYTFNIDLNLKNLRKTGLSRS
jgi:hypothetical protein